MNPKTKKPLLSFTVHWKGGNISEATKKSARAKLDAFFTNAKKTITIKIPCKTSK